MSHRRSRDDRSYRESRDDRSPSRRHEPHHQESSGGGGGAYRHGNYYPNAPSQPPPQPAQTRSDDAYIKWLFQRVDTNNNGSLDAVELQRALSNGAGTPFNLDTVKLMIGMFDKHRTCTVTQREFSGLWKYISEWCNTFRRFDSDGSGQIDQSELKRCLSTFGYRLTDGFYDKLVSRFDRSRSGNLNFDDFVQLCLMLQTLTLTFKEKDTERKGKIYITYEDFLLMTCDVALKAVGRS